MTTDKKTIVRNNAVFVLTTFLCAIFTAIIGVIIVAKDFGAITHYKSYLPLIVGIWTAYIAMYVYIRYILTKDKDIECSVNNGVAICFITIMLTVWMCCAMMAYFSPYAIPIVFVSLIIAVLLRQRLGYMATVITTIIVAMLGIVMYQNDSGIATFMSQTLGLMLSMLTAIIMIYLIRQGYSRFKLSLGAVLVALAFVPIVFVMTVLRTEWTVEYAIKHSLYYFAGNITAIALFTMILPLYELITRIWTDFKYAEMCSFSQPLLKQLKEQASGTFNHSLTVANLAESCAIKLGINPYKARACACYHDIGKIKTPQLFVENQVDGHNPHDELIPEISAKMIMKHAKAGEEILKQHRFPQEVIKATIEHHGDTPVLYFYLMAKNLTVGELDIDEYRYEGPRPTSKYSAIVMLCDVCEAMTRAKAPANKEELELLVGNAIKEKLLDGQFDDCDITIADLEKIKITICEVIPAMFHKRINYEKAKEKK